MVLEAHLVGHFRDIAWELFIKILYTSVFSDGLSGGPISGGPV